MLIPAPRGNIALWECDARAKDIRERHWRLNFLHRGMPAFGTDAELPDEIRGRLPILGEFLHGDPHERFARVEMRQGVIEPVCHCSFLVKSYGHSASSGFFLFVPHAEDLKCEACRASRGSVKLKRQYDPIAYAVAPAP